MKQVSLSGSIRENVGKKDAKAVRNADRVPCVVYGGGEQTHFSVKHSDMEKLVYTPNVNIVEVDVDGKKVRTIIQDVQHHPITDRIHHVDFIELKDDKKVKVNVPVVITGRAIGVLNGGRLSQVFRTLKVYALPGELPDAITVDISDLRIGMSVRVRDLMTDKLEILNAPSAVVASVKMARGAVDEDEEEEEELDEDGNPIAPAEGEEGGEAAAE
ncbi:MAG: 50S ribosomal protein L25/general stress protein Ctc [Crocinitomix sp. MedPE-SWsnd]|nr:MAG: 50S ribosomal protein L25/general stress protein Ctc [Crocinitomix sp. MedPE-SWsnd]